MKRFKLLLTITCLFADNVHAITWQRTYDGGEGYCVQETSDSSFLVTGKRSSTPWSFKTDTLGNFFWEYNYGGSWVEEISGDDCLFAGSPDLQKTNSQGDSIWVWDYGIASRCVQETSDGGYIITGGDDQNWVPLVLIKTDSNGDLLWEKTYADPIHNIVEGYFVRETSDGGYIVTGVTGISIEELDNKWLWLLKTDSLGDTLWTQKYSGTEVGSFFENWGRCVRQTLDGGYIVAGDRDPGGFWLLKTDEKGDTLWTRTFGGEYCRSVIIANDGNFVAVGRGPATNAWERSLPNGGDVLLVKVDPDGNTIWSRNHGGNDVDAAYCVAQTSDGGYIVSGWSGSFNPVGLYLLKTDSLGLIEAIAEEPIPELPRNWKVLTYLGNQIILSYWDQPYGFHVSVFDVTGRKVDGVKTNLSAGTLIWGYEYPAGVYFIQVNEANQTSTAKIVLVK